MEKAKRVQSAKTDLPWWVELLFVQIGLPDSILRSVLKTRKSVRKYTRENKKSIFGGDNVRYAYKYKQGLIDGFINIHDAIIPWNKIRYIF